MNEVKIPIYPKDRADHTHEWEVLLQGSEADFPIEAGFANHFFSWPHIIEGEWREYFDCTDLQSFRFIPPVDYLEAYWEAKSLGII